MSDEPKQMLPQWLLDDMERLELRAQDAEDRWMAWYEASKDERPAVFRIPTVSDGEVS